MHLKRSPNKKTGRIYLSMVRTYRVKGEKYPKTDTVESFGYLDELVKLHDDPIAHFEKYVEDKNLAEQQETAEYTIKARKDQRLEKNTATRRNYGYIVIMKLYYELGLDGFLLNRQRRETKIECNTSTIMKMLIINRILSPGSKKRAYNERGRYFDFENEDAFELVDVYRSLSHFATLEKDIQLLLHNRITKTYGRNLDLVYYDVTNYYFEIDMEDELRKKGVSKEHRPNPIVQMGLATDADGLPISYEVFPGNESEKLHLRPMVSELYRKYDCKKVIAVADSAQNTGNNVYYLDQGKQGYVFSQSIRGGSKALKEYVVDEAGYKWLGNEYKRKSRVERREIQVDFDRKDGTTHKKKVLVDQRQIVFYSEKYAVRSKALREAALKKAEKIINDPAAYTRAMAHGALKYVMNVDVDKDTGEIKAAKSGTPCFNLDVIREEEKYDGYYAIVTNVFDEREDNGKFGDDQIIDIYRGLWRVEDSFSVTKGELETRPFFLTREERIKAHLLICFISLVIVRLIQKRTAFKQSPEKLIEAMNKLSCSLEGGNLYLFDYRSDVADDLAKAFGLDFSMLRLTRAEIKKNIGDAKKG
jgi:transposase